MTVFAFRENHHRVLGYGWTTLDLRWIDNLTYSVAISDLGGEFAAPYPSIRHLNRLVNLRKNCRGVDEVLRWSERRRASLITVEAPPGDSKRHDPGKYVRSFSHRFVFRSLNDAFEFRMRFN